MLKKIFLQKVLDGKKAHWVSVSINYASEFLRRCSFTNFIKAMMRSSRTPGTMERAAGWCKAAGTGSELASEPRPGNVTHSSVTKYLAPDGLP